jgi:protein SCO1/2
VTSTFRWRLAAIIAAGILTAAGLTGCSKSGPAFRNTDITGASYASRIELTDQDGRRRTLADFRGKVVTVFFGFTQCPDVCPTTLAEMQAVLKALGDRARDVQVLFVTVDPERDTGELLKAYLGNFDPSFVGLRGSAEETAAVTKEFKVFVQKVPGKTPGSYTIDHTAGTYVFDRAGRIRLFVRHGQGIEPIVHDVRLLLDQPAG